jgi:hypothetical protein
VKPVFSSWADLIGPALGLIGTALGVMNFVVQSLERRVRVKIIPKAAFPVNGGYYSVTGERNDQTREDAISGKAIPCLEVVNLSLFAVTIDEVGYCDSAKLGSARAPFIGPNVIPDRGAPVRLESRESKTFYWHDNVLEELIQNKYGSAFATTACGTTSKARLKNFPFA